MEQAGAAARGATLYVTLEPCCHWGRTPPCADAIVEAGVARVVAAIQDPDPRVNGGGFAKLRRAGVDVSVGVGADEAHALASGFLHHDRHGVLELIALDDTPDGLPAGTDALLTPMPRGRRLVTRSQDIGLVGVPTDRLLDGMSALGLTSVAVLKNDPSSPRVLHVVGHVASPMHRLYGWPDGLYETRLVMIVDGEDRDTAAALPMELVPELVGYDPSIGRERRTEGDLVTEGTGGDC